jgi:hypothetical protein
MWHAYSDPIASEQGIRVSKLLQSSQQLLRPNLEMSFLKCERQVNSYEENDWLMNHGHGYPDFPHDAFQSII